MKVKFKQMLESFCIHLRNLGACWNRLFFTYTVYDISLVLLSTVLGHSLKDPPFHCKSECIIYELPNPSLKHGSLP